MGLGIKGKGEFVRSPTWKFQNHFFLLRLLSNCPPPPSERLSGVCSSLLLRLTALTSSQTGAGDHHPGQRRHRDLRRLSTKKRNIIKPFSLTYNLGYQ